MTTNQEKIDATIKRFPETFGLRKVSGLFRISRFDSFVNDVGDVILYTEVFVGERGLLSYAKATERELSENLVRLV